MLHATFLSLMLPAFTSTQPQRLQTGPIDITLPVFLKRFVPFSKEAGIFSQFQLAFHSLGVLGLRIIRRFLGLDLTLTCDLLIVCISSVLACSLCRNDFKEIFELPRNARVLCIRCALAIFQHLARLFLIFCVCSNAECTKQVSNLLLTNQRYCSAVEISSST